jgi:hypothetical protein
LGRTVWGEMAVNSKLDMILGRTVWGEMGVNSKPDKLDMISGSGSLSGGQKSLG